jgi:hypothetical protein
MQTVCIFAHIFKYRVFGINSQLAAWTANRPTDDIDESGT